VAEAGAAGDVDEAALAAAWLAVHDAVLAGLNHALSNRAAAAAALAAVVEPHEAPGEEIATDVAAEARRLGELLQLYRRLPRATSSRAVPLQLAAVLPVAVQLAAHGTTRSREMPCALTIDDALPPVTAREDALTHALLALLFAAGRWALAAEHGRLAARVAGGDAAVLVVVEGVREGGAVPHDGGAAVSLARWLLDDAAGVVEETREGERLRYTLTMPATPAGAAARDRPGAQRGG